ncbi:MAG: hypothetical protein J6334_13990 [Kiritimatiellae bacterium]|nr:hypothetical protein [Kiritimatiellia bacterium]
MTQRALPKDLKRRLSRMIARIRWILFIRGLLAVLAIAVAGILAVMAIDAAIVLIHPAARWGVSLTVAAMVLLTAWSALIRPLCQKLSLTRIARVLETRHPELQERISSAIELCEQGEGDSSVRASRELLDLLTQEARSDITGIKTRNEFSWRSARPFLTALFAAGALFAAILAIWPREGWHLFRRAVEPYREFDTIEALAIKVHPGDRTLLSGHPIRFEVEAPYRRGHRAELLFDFHDRTKRIERMLDMSDPKERKTATYALELPAVTRSFSYRIRYGNALTRPFTLRIVDPPAVKAARVAIRYPDYLDRPATQLTARVLMPLEVVEGTRLSITATFDRPCEAALLFGKHRLPPALGDRSTNAWWRQTALASRSGEWALAIRDADRFTNTLEWATFTVLPDHPPAVTFSRPTADKLHIPPSDPLVCEGRARDDWGIGTIELVARGKEGDERLWPAPVTQPRECTFSVKPDLQALWNEGIKEFDLFFRVSDKRSPELGGNHVVESRKIKVRLDEWARLSREQVREETLRKMERLMHQAHQKLHEAANRIAQEKHTYNQPTLPEKAVSKLEQARENTLEAENQLEEAAQATEKTPFAEFANELLDLRDKKVDEALKKVEAVTAAEPENRRQAGEEAEQELRKAAEAINQMFQKLQEESRRQEAASQLHALAQREEQLAREAESPLQKWAQNEWANRQQEAEQRLDQIRDRLRDDEAVNGIKRELQQARDTMRQAQQEQTPEEDGKIWFERMSHDEVRKAALAAEQAAQTALEANEKAEQAAEAKQAEDAVQKAAAQTTEAAKAALEAAESARNAAEDRQTTEQAADAAARREAAQEALAEANENLEAAQKAAAEARQQVNDALNRNGEPQPQPDVQNGQPQPNPNEALELARQAAEKEAEAARQNVEQAEQALQQAERDLKAAQEHETPPEAVAAQAAQAVAQAKEALAQAQAAQEAIRNAQGNADPQDNPESQNDTESPDNPGSPESPGNSEQPDNPETPGSPEADTPQNPMFQALEEAAALAEEADRLSMQAGERLEQAERMKGEEPQNQNRESTRLAMEEAQTAAALAREAMQKTQSTLRQMAQESSRLRQQAESAARQAQARANRADQQARQAQDKLKNNPEIPMAKAAEQTAESAHLSQQASQQAQQAVQRNETEPAQSGQGQAQRALELAREALKAAEDRPQAAGKQQQAAQQARQLADRLNAMTQAMDQREAEAWAQAQGRLKGINAMRQDAAGRAENETRPDPFLELNSHWMRLKGKLHSENESELLRQTPAEYRPLVKQYFDELGKPPKTP